MTNDYSYINPKSFEKSSNEAIAELHETIITLRARILTLEKQIKDDESRLRGIKNDTLNKKRAFENGLKLLNSSNDELIKLRSEVKYYEDNVDLVWKRRIRPEKLIEQKEKAIQEGKYTRFTGGWQKILGEIKKVFDKETKELKELRHKYKILSENNENMPVPQSILTNIDDRVTNLQNELKLARDDIDYYKKYIKDKSIITKRLNSTGRQQRRSLRDQLNIKR